MNERPRRIFLEGGKEFVLRKRKNLNSELHTFNS
jgi:hypothetical protein